MKFKRKGISFGACRHTFGECSVRWEISAGRFFDGAQQRDMSEWYDHRQSPI